MRILLVAAIGIWTMTLTAQDPLATGSVSGRVFDADTLAPVNGARVGSTEIGYVLTDHEGRYTLRGLKPGRVHFSIRHQSTSAPWPDKVVTVLAGGEITAVDFRYRLEAQITGRVLDENGKPLSGVGVIALTRELGPDGEMRYQVAGPSPRLTTDARGEYAINQGILAGRSYWLLAYQLRKYANPITDPSGDALPRMQVLAATFYPDADSISTAVPIVPRSLENRIADIRMLKKPAYCLEATLIAGTTPAQMKFMVSEEDRYAAEFRGLPNGQEGGISGTDGKIRLCNLPPGRYRLAAIAASYNGLSAPEHFNTAGITIVDRDVRGISLSALPPATVSGEVVWDSPPSDPALLQSIVELSLDPAPSIPVPAIYLSIPSPFSFKATPGLSYNVRVSSRDSTARLYVKDLTVGNSSILRKSYVPGSEPLRITVAHDGGVIRASVADAGGRPSRNSAIIVFPTTVQTEFELAATMVEGLTDENGVFQTRPLQPGGYTVLATDDPPPYTTRGAYGTLNIQRSPEALARILRARSRGQSVEIGPRAAIQINLMPGTLD